MTIFRRHVVVVDVPPQWPALGPGVFLGGHSPSATAHCVIPRLVRVLSKKTTPTGGDDRTA
eukprot:scaffold8005_cov275-Amphora_coffeaeformis.AAC.19